MLNNSKKRAIVRAYDQGMSLPDVAALFKVSYHTIVNIVHLNKCKGVKYV